MWKLEIERVSNGYKIKTYEAEKISEEFVIADNLKDELDSHENLLWEVMDYFNFGGSKHDKERIRINRQKRGE